MATKSKPSIISVVADIALAYVKRVNDLLQLAVLEAQLALKTIVVIAILIFILGSVLTACWLSVLALLFFYLVSIHYTFVSACALVVVLNFFVLTFILFLIYKIKDNLFFPATCGQLNYNSHSKAVIKNE